MADGRPTKYKAEYCKIASKMCELGAIDAEIADALGVSVRTLHRWKAEHADFCHSLKIGKAATDDRIEMALYHRAAGYSHQEDDIRVINGEIVITPTIKHYPPDTAACFIWLKNRRTESWKPDSQFSEGATGDSLADAISKLADKLPA